MQYFVLYGTKLSLCHQIEIQWTTEIESWKKKKKFISAVQTKNNFLTFCILLIYLSNWKIEIQSYFINFLSHPPSSYFCLLLTSWFWWHMLSICDQRLNIGKFPLIKQVCIVFLNVIKYKEWLGMRKILIFLFPGARRTNKKRTGNWSWTACQHHK